MWGRKAVSQASTWAQWLDFWAAAGGQALGYRGAGGGGGVVWLTLYHGMAPISSPLFSAGEWEFEHFPAPSFSPESRWEGAAVVTTPICHPDPGPGMGYSRVPMIHSLSLALLPHAASLSLLHASPHVSLFRQT